MAPGYPTPENKPIEINEKILGNKSACFQPTEEI
jgi:hypothetical protein